MDIFVPPMMFKNSGNMGLPLAVLAFGEAGQPAAVVLVAPVPNHLPGLTGRDAAMFILFGALPPAVLNCLVAERYRQEPERVASIVLIGNLASLAIIPLTLAWVL